MKTVKVGGRILEEDDAWKLYLELTDKLQPKEAKVLKLRPIGETIEAAKHIGENPGLSTGFPSLDQMTGGFRPGEVIVLFGDTGHGKSQLAQNIAYRMSSDGIPVMFVGFEMTDEENTNRFKGLSDAGYDGIELLPIIYPPEGISLGWSDMDELIRLASEAGVQLAIIDHLHAMQLPPAGNKADALEDMMYQFKALARKYKLPLMVISHTSRREGNALPHLYNLKGSSAIEQCADIAIGVWRKAESDVLKVYIDKHRRGTKLRQVELEIGEDAQLREPLIAAFPGAREV